jgi:hypothetical protein
MRTSWLDDEPPEVRFLRIFLVCVVAALPLLGVTPSSLVARPIVIVFPFTLSASDVDKESGARLAVIVATGIANNGGVVLKPAPPGTERKNYLSVARAIGADYYVSGYITPLGDAVSVVEQVVSTQSGILIASNTAQITTYADAAGQGATLGDEILHHHNRNLEAFTAPPPPAAATPTPEPTGAAQADIGKLFNRRKGKTAAPAASASPVALAAAVTPAPSPSPAPSVKPAPRAAQQVAATAPKPGPTATPKAATPTPVAVAPPNVTIPAASSVASGSSLGILAIGGSATETLREAARADLATNLTAAKIATVTENGTTCSSGVTRLAGGSLSMTEVTTLGQTVYTATFDLTVTDCSGKVLLRKTYDHDAGQDLAAVERVVMEAAVAIERPERRHR